MQWSNQWIWRGSLMKCLLLMQTPIEWTLRESSLHIVCLEWAIRLFTFFFAIRNCGELSHVPITTWITWWLSTLTNFSYSPKCCNWNMGCKTFDSYIMRHCTRYVLCLRRSYWICAITRLIVETHRDIWWSLEF